MSANPKRPLRKRLQNVLNVRTDDKFRFQLEALRRNEHGPKIPSQSAMVRLLVERAYDRDCKEEDSKPLQHKARSKHDA